jgi:hypothetical protein
MVNQHLLWGLRACVKLVEIKLYQKKSFKLSNSKLIIKLQLHNQIV